MPEHTHRATQSTCPFIRSNYKCSWKELENWTSCCKANTCKGECGTSRLPSESKTLFLGNSHIREIMQATVCQNLHELQSVTYITASTTGTRSAVTYKYMDKELWRWKDGGFVSVAIQEDDLAVYSFLRNVTLIGAINHPVTYMPMLLNNSTRSEGLEGIGRALGFNWNDITGVVFNKGNERAWAGVTWCNKSLWSLNPSVCQGLGKDISVKKPAMSIVIPQGVLDGLDELEWKGNIVFTNDITKTPETIDTQKSHPYTISYLAAENFAVTDAGLRYVPNSKRQKHPCLPGPPDDGAKMLLHSIYRQ